MTEDNIDLTNTPEDLPEPSKSKKKKDYMPNLETEAAADICEEPGTEKKQYWITDRFIKDAPRSDYLIVGFDTEYQQLHEYVDSKTVRAGKAKYEPLSYQFHALHPDGTTWSGIAIPDEGGRLSLSEFLVFVLAKGAQFCKSVPKTIVLVGHYNKADVPAFEERKPLMRRLSNTGITADGR
jgi:hypothetical protein